MLFQNDTQLLPKGIQQNMFLCRFAEEVACHFQRLLLLVAGYNFAKDRKKKGYLDILICVHGPLGIDVKISGEFICIDPQFLGSTLRCI